MEKEKSTYNGLLQYEEAEELPRKELAEHKLNIPKSTLKNHPGNKKEYFPAPRGKASVGDILTFIFPQTKVSIDNQETTVQISSK